MARASHRILNVCALMPLLAASFPVLAQDTPYTPPPLFGAGAEVRIIDVVPLPTLPPEPPVVLNPPVIEKLDTSGNISLEESASVSERVQNPIQTRAPINTDVLLDHPADRVAEKARHVLAPSDQIPDLLSYEADAPPLPVPTQGSTANVQKDLSIPHTASKPKTRVSMNPSFEKTINDRPKVAVYSRNKETGEFVQVQGADTTTGQKTTYRARNITSTARETGMSAAQPQKVQRNALTDLDGNAVPPLTMADLQGRLPGVDDAAPTMPGMAPPLPLPDRRAARTEPAAGASAEKTISPGPQSTVTIYFAPDQTDLSDPMQAEINNNILTRLSQDPARLVAIHAYTPTGIKNGQRLSLARALAVRQYLKNNGIASERMIVRALVQGTPESDGGVDLILQ